MSVRSSTRLWCIVAAWLGLSAALVACEEDKKPSPPPAVSQAASPVVSAAPSAPAPARMPEVSLTKGAVQLGIDELALTVPSFDVAFRDLLHKYPVSSPASIIVNIDRKAPVEVTSRVLYQLFDQGAKQLEVRTQARGTYPSTLLLVPEKDAGKLPACTLVGMITQDLGTSFWPMRGSRAKRFSKGMAGPDLSAMHDVFQKDEGLCGSPVFFFSADDTVEWGHAFDLAVSVQAHQPPYKVQKFVLLRQRPNPGNAIKVGS